MRFVVAFLVSVCLLQRLNALPIDDLINELKPRIIEASTQVSTVRRESGIKIGKTHGAIEEAITVLEHDLGQKRSELQESVKKAQADAATSEKNIDACVREVDDGLKTWNKRSLEMCRIRPELNRLRWKLAQVGRLRGVLGGAIFRCSVPNRGDLDKIKECVEGIVADVEKQAADAAEEIDAAIATDQENANQCANNAASGMREQLEKLVNDFSNCVNNA